jgi:hypothetical protein
VLRGFVNRIPDPERPLLWWGFAAVVKGLLFWHMLGQPYISSSRQGTLAVCSGDCETYLGPIDHWIEQGQYVPVERMPGYGAIYLLGRVLLPEGQVLNGMILFQLICGVLATWILAWGVYRLSGSRWAFIICFLLYTLGCTVSDYDRFILTESPVASMLVFAFGCVMRYRTGGGPGWLGAAGLFLVWAYFMRPVLMPFYLLSGAVALVVFVRRKSYRPLLLFVLPFLMIQGAWSVYNRMERGKWFLFTEHRYLTSYAPHTQDQWAFVSTFEDMKLTYFDPEPTWKDRAEGEAQFRAFTFPDDIYAPGLTKDSLLQLQRYAISMRFDDLDSSARRELESRYVDALRRYTAVMKEHHPFIVHVRTPLRLIARHLFAASGVQNLYIVPFRELSWPSRIVKLFFIGVYLVALYGAMLFIVTAVRRMRSRPFEAMIAAMLLYGLLVHPVMIRTADVRYLYVFFPLMCLCSALFLGRSLERLAYRWTPKGPGTVPSMAP